MYVQDEDGENSEEVGDGLQDSETGPVSNQDDFLPPLFRLEKYATSDNIFNRQMVGRLALETLRGVADSPADVATVMAIVNRMTEDSEMAVRAELMEQVPHIAMLCHEDRDRLHSLVLDYLLPMVVKFLGDTDNQVRKTAQAALLVLMEQGLVEMGAVEEHVCPVILMFTELDSLVEFHTGAVALMSKMAPLIGRNTTERLFMNRFAALCSDPVFYIRKVCATNFGEFCSVVGTQSTEEILLSRFVELCGDEIWGVRKACAEVFMSVSCACTLATRKQTLAPVFANLLVDQSRWVRMSAFQTLGPFISTFADLSITGLAYNQHGELVLMNPERLEFRLSNSQVCDNEVIKPITESKLNTSSVSDNGVITVSNVTASTSNVAQTSNSDNSEPTVISKVCDMREPVPLSGVNIKESVDISQVSVKSGTEARTEVGDCVARRRQGEGEGDEDSQRLRVSESSDRLHVRVESGRVDTNSFNTFQYWRVPIPELELDISPTEKLQPASFHVRAKVKDEVAHRTSASELNVRLDVENSNMVGNLASHLEQCSLGDVMEVSEQAKQAEICSASVALVTENTTVVSSAVQKAVMFVRQSRHMPDVKMTRIKLYDPMEDPLGDFSEDAPEESLPLQGTPISTTSTPVQDIVPQLLIDHFVSMTHPSQAQTTDNEIAHYCAFSIPAVALTLGRANWSLLKKAYEALASDMQWKVRRTVASSIHELAVILGEDLATKDLVPVFNGFIKDLDEVRIGALKHLADFLKLLRPLDRNSYLDRLSNFYYTDNECNWRYREELAAQLLMAVTLFSPADTRKHITPLAISLLMDKVAAVRHMALFLVTQLVHHVSLEEQLVRSLLAELAEQFAHNKHWNRRQIFALLCSRLVTDQVLEDEHFARDVLPHLLDLSWDPVPNVRLAVARTLATDVMAQPYFSSEESPHHEVLVQMLKLLQKDGDRDVRFFASSHCVRRSTSGTNISALGQS